MFEPSDPQQHLADVIEKMVAKPDERNERAQLAARIVPSVFRGRRRPRATFAIVKQLSQ